MGTPIRVPVDGREAAKQRRGRPPRPMPERIDAPPERIAQAVLSKPPKKDWRYLQGK